MPAGRRATLEWSSSRFPCRSMPTGRFGSSMPKGTSSQAQPWPSIGKRTVSLSMLSRSEVGKSSSSIFQSAPESDSGHIADHEGKSPEEAEPDRPRSGWKEDPAPANEQLAPRAGSHDADRGGDGGLRTDEDGASGRDHRRKADPPITPGRNPRRRRGTNEEGRGEGAPAAPAAEAGRRG